MILNDKDSELLKTYRSRLQAYANKTLTNKDLLAADIGISIMTLNRLLACQRVKYGTLLKVERFLAEEEKAVK